MAHEGGRLVAAVGRARCPECGAEDLPVYWYGNRPRRGPHYRVRCRAGDGEARGQGCGFNQEVVPELVEFVDGWGPEGEVAA